jgi:anti-sigma B factor antagonist
MTVSEPEDGGPVLVELGGELDIAGLSDVAPQVDALLELAPEAVRLDLAELRFLDSSGVAVLVRLANHVGRVTTTDAAPAVRRVLQVMGLAGRLGLGAG